MLNIIFFVALMFIIPSSARGAARVLADSKEVAATAAADSATVVVVSAVAGEIKRAVDSIEKLDPLADGISSVELLQVAGSDLDIVNAARVSLGKMSKEFSEADRKLLAYLVKNQHGTPFEHTMLKFRIKCPIFVARHWMRHRVGVSFNEISARYTELPEEMYVPATFRRQSKSNRQASDAPFSDDASLAMYKKVCVDTYAAYRALLAAGVCREQARGVLPVCLYTELFFTCNVRSLMHFLQLRLGSGAQSETSLFAKALLDLSEPKFPATIGILREALKATAAK